MSEANPNTVWAETFIDGLARGGVRYLSLAPGSRSIPLVLAAAAHADLRLFTHVDERAAAYFALGIGKRSGGPAALITTSGTAAGNLYPAVIEAAQSEIPLLVLTADRPGYLRGMDANQTIDQQRLYGAYTRAFLDAGPPALRGAARAAHDSLAARALAAVAGPVPGPVHVNFPFDKPLEPVAGGQAPTGRALAVHRAAPTADAVTVRAVAETITSAARVLLVAGPSRNPGTSGPAVLRLAEHLGAPLLADALSGTRFGAGAGSGALHAYDAYLRTPESLDALAPDCIVRFGAACTSSAVHDFLAYHTGVPQVVIDDGWRWKDHVGSASDHVPADATIFAEALIDTVPIRAANNWTARWHAFDRRARDAMARAAAGAAFEASTMATLAAGLPAGTTLFVGNSMPVRDLDRYVSAREAPLHVFGNRGASGIDGLVSTAAGLAVGTGASVVSVIGDLSFLHDLGGMHIVRAERLPLVLIVINNDGGGIFHMLPVREHEPAFTRHVVVPHGIDLARAAALFDVPHRLLTVEADLASAVMDAVRQGGPTLIEIRTDREHGRARREADLRAVAAEVRAVLAAGDQ